MANIARRSPYGDIARFDPFFNIDEWFKGFPMHPFAQQAEAAPQIKIDVTEDDAASHVHAEIPGAKKEDIKVQIDGNRVTISAETKEEKEEKEGERVIYRERRVGASYRTFTLASEVDEAKAEAKYENGILELTLPKKEGKTAKRIDVK
jgi:HSP20 family protein